MKKWGTKALLILYLSCYLFLKVLFSIKLPKSLTIDLIIISLSFIFTFKSFKKNNN